MVTHRISAALLSLAAHRWPTGLRDELRREWTAELHVLSEGGRSWAMLRYALSLAVSRPVADRSTVPLGRRAWHAIRLVLLAPVLCIALYFAGLIAMTLIVRPLEATGSAFLGTVAYHAQVPLPTVFCLLSAALMYQVGARWSRGSGIRPATAVMVAVVPGPILTLLALLLLSGPHKVARHAPVYACYFALLTVVLITAARLRRADRPRRAWWTALLGALIAADLAVMLPFLDSPTARDEGMSLATAPLWLFASLTDWGFGVIPGMGVFMISDLLELGGQLLLVFTGFALGAVFAAARATAPAPVPEAGAVAES